MTVKNTKKTRRKYDTTFKEDVLKMVASGRPVPEIAQALGIGDTLIYRWKNAPKSGSVKANIYGSDAGTHQDAFIEIERLRADLRRAEQERDILKKALGILGRGI